MNPCRRPRTLTNSAPVRAPPFPDPRSVALLVVDMQRDYMEHGALAVPGASTIIPVINHYVAQFANANAAIYFSRDWHPLNHCSFQNQGGRWPVHCVAQTPGADFVHSLPIPDDAVIVSKGIESAHEAYSAFEGTALAQLLHERGIHGLWIAGVTTEHSVRASVLDALKAGFKVTVLVDAIRSSGDPTNSADHAMREMLDAGAQAHSWARPAHKIARRPH